MMYLVQLAILRIIIFHFQKEVSKF